MYIYIYIYVYIYIYIHIYIYIYIYIFPESAWSAFTAFVIIIKCMIVLSSNVYLCLSSFSPSLPGEPSQPTHIYIYIYIYIHSQTV